MTNKDLTRRQILTKGGVLGAALAFFQRPDSASAASTGLEGTWLVTLTFPQPNQGPGLSPYRALYTYIPGGSLTLTSEKDRLILPTGYLQSPGHGAWRKIGNQTFRLRYLAFNDVGVLGSGSAIENTLRVQEVVTLTSTNSYTGTLKSVLTDRSGTVLATDTATTNATRITV